MAQFAGTVDKVTVKDREIQIVLKARLDNEVLASVANFTGGHRVTVAILSEQLEIVACDEDGMVLRGQLTITSGERNGG